MVEVIILIPLAGNDGQEFSAPHFEAFESHLADNFGGFSRLPGEILGVWVNEGDRYADRLVGYLVALQSITEGGKLLDTVEVAKWIFEQKAIYLRYLGISEIR